MDGINGIEKNVYNFNFQETKKKSSNYYKRLSMNTTFSRLFRKLRYNRMQRVVCDKIYEDQGGFTQGSSCKYNLFSLQQVLEKKIRK